MTRTHVSIKAVLVTGVAVLALWALSFVASYLPLGAASLPVALGIAAVKAVLVALFFMELVRESLSVKMTIFSAFALTATLIAFMVTDIVTRDPPALVPAAAEAPRRVTTRHANEPGF
jgi:cytochrome c oxidase subunit 4